MEADERAGVATAPPRVCAVTAAEKRTERPIANELRDLVFTAPRSLPPRRREQIEKNGTKAAIIESRHTVMPKLRLGGARAALVVLTLLNLLNYLDRFVLASLVESLKASELHLSDKQLGAL